jgi:hypothetical protein
MPTVRSHFTADHGLLWVFTLVKYPPKMMYRLSKLCAYVINVCMKSVRWKCSQFISTDKKHKIFLQNNNNNNRQQQQQLRQAHAAPLQQAASAQSNVSILLTARTRRQHNAVHTCMRVSYAFCCRNSVGGMRPLPRSVRPGMCYTRYFNDSHIRKAENSGLKMCSKTRGCVTWQCNAVP